MVQPRDGTALLDARYRPHVDSVAAARAAYCEWATPLVGDDDVVAELAIVVSELLANAVAASPDDASPLHLVACRAGDDLVIEVTNTAAPDGDEPAWDMSDPLRGGGRGLLIVRSLVDQLEMRTADGTTTVASRRHIDSWSAAER